MVNGEKIMPESVFVTDFLADPIYEQERLQIAGAMMEYYLVRESGLSGMALSWSKVAEEVYIPCLEKGRIPAAPTGFEEESLSKDELKKMNKEALKFEALLKEHGIRRSYVGRDIQFIAEKLGIAIRIPL